MKWIVHQDAGSFGARVKPLLYQEEDINHLFIGVLEQLERGYYESGFMALAEEEDGQAAAVCLMTFPEPLQLKIFKEWEGWEESLIDLLMSEGVQPEGLIGSRGTVGQFADEWRRRKGNDSQVLMDSGLYRINAAVSGLKKSPGAWRVANRHDGKLLADWYLNFEQEERFVLSSEIAAAKRMARFIQDKEVYVWETEGRIVACLKKSRPTKRGISLSFVYAPPEFRHKGFVRTLIAEVTEELLMEFDFIILYGDFLDEDAKKLYREIGYEKIDDPVQIVLH